MLKLNQDRNKNLIQCNTQKEMRCIFIGKLSRRRRKFKTLKGVNEREKHFPNLISGESRMSFDVCCVKLKPFCVLSHLNSCDVILEKMLMRGLEVGCNFIVFKGHMWCSEW